MKTIVITGSTRGLGLEMAKDFLDAGCNVTISGRSKNMPETLKKDLTGFNDNVLYMHCDVRSEPDIENLWNASMDKWKRVDIWINNAGQNCPHEFCHETDALYIDAVIDTNIKGIIFGSRVAARNMILQGFGQIWNMEGLGSNGMIQEKTIIYGTTKRALTYFTKAFARELKKTPVKIGRLSPGMMLTDFITKTPDGAVSPLLKDKNFKYIFNTLADMPQTVSGFLTAKILSNAKNDAHIAWLTNRKIILRFMVSPFNKRKLI